MVVWVEQCCSSVTVVAAAGYFPVLCCLPGVFGNRTMAEAVKYVGWERKRWRKWKGTIVSKKENVEREVSEGKVRHKIKQEKQLNHKRIIIKSRFKKSKKMGLRKVKLFPTSTSASETGRQ